MSNYTHPIYKQKAHHWYESSSECTNGKLAEAKSSSYSSVELRIETKIHDPEYFSMSVPNDVFSLRFISCGRPQLSAFAFEEFLNVFQFPVWSCIVVAVIALVLFKLIIIDWPKKKSLGKIFLSTLHFMQMLMEQGSSFVDACTSNAWRVSLGLYLLMAIILSNAYRNTNVYNMVKPRVPIPYETFTQLVKDNFTIFTRNAISPDFKLFPPGGLVNTSSFLLEPHTIWFLDFDVMLFISELKKPEISANNHQQRHLIMNGPVQILQKHSKLHPELLNVFNKTGLEYGQHGNKESSEQFWSKKLEKSELSVLEDTLSYCRKTALILPNHLVTKIALKMQHLGNLYVGRESLVESIITFDLSGYIPPQVLVRIKSVSWAGILQRWVILSRNKAHLNHNSKQIPKPQKPDMSGNMLILFVLLLSGLVCSLVAFKAECSLKICCKIITLQWQSLRCSTLKLILLSTQCFHNKSSSFGGTGLH